MDTVADYEAWKAKRQQSAVGAAGVALGSVEQSPDEAASDVNLGNEFAKVTGNPVPPPPMVREYRGTFAQAVNNAKNSTILSSSPRLTEWLRDPQNAAVASDDLSNLSWWETPFAAAGNAISRGVQRIPQAYNQYRAETAAQTFQDQSRSFGDILADQDAIRDRTGKPVATTPLPGPDDLLFAGLRYYRSRFADLFGVDEKQAAQYYQQQVGQIAQRINTIPMSPGATRFRDALNSTAGQGDVWQQIGNFAKHVGSDPGGAAAYFSEAAVESAPQLAAAIGVTAATRNPGAGALFMGVQSGVEERYLEPSQFFAEKGIDISTADGAAQVISNPALIQEAAQRGVLRGTIIGAMNGLSGGVAGTELAKNPIGNMVLQQITQAAIGGAGEAWAEQAVDGHVDFQQVLTAAAGQAVLAPLEVLGVGGRGFLEGRAKARDAEARQTLFQSLAGQAVNSKLRARMPDAFRDFVARATVDGPVENVYVPADQFRQYFQDQGVDPYAVVDQLEGVSRDDLDTALAGGGDLQIPTATYAAKIAGTEDDPFFMENMRFDPDEFTSAEAKAFNEKSAEIMQQAAEEAERIRQEHEALRSHEQEIYDTMVSRLRQAGRSTDVATTEAMLYPAFYRVMAERSGLTTEEFMQRYPLPEVHGSIPEGMQLRNVDELNRTLAEARARKTVRDTRQTLLEFIDQHGGINDVGGELRSRNAEEVKRGAGKKTLRLARTDARNQARDLFGTSNGKKFGTDDVAQAAIEAGFMADDPTVIEYQNAVREGRQVPDISKPLFDAIDRELAGEPQYSREQRQDQRIAENARLDEIEAYLHSLDVSLADSNETIRQAIERAGEGRKYAQEQRGSIQFPASGVGTGPSIINLFQSANLSTLVHESGHYFLTVMQDIAAKGEAGAIADMETLKGWWRENAADVARDASKGGVEVSADDVRAALDGGEIADVRKAAAIDVGMQEQFARAFEQYLMEGKAPSVELRGAFEKFRAWLISIYQRLTGLNVKVSDEVRQVFDRMLASDQEIAQARTDAGDTGPLFSSADDMGLTPEEYAKFRKLYAQAEEDAKAKMLREAMAPIKREREQWFKDERAKVRDEVEGQINAYRYYRAIEWMGNKRWLGEGQPEEMPDIRLSKDILVDRYGEGVLKTLPRGKQTVYALEGGLDPDDAAGWFGFDSGDEMIRAMEKAPNRKEAIEAETDKVMRDRHGDVLNDGTAEATALDAVHNDKRSQALAAELKSLIDIAGTGVGLTHKEAREVARVTINGTRVRDAMNANRFLSAERKAGEEAARLGAIVAREKLWADAARRRVATKARGVIKGEGTFEGVVSQQDRANASTGNYNETVAKLIEAKRRQLFNHALYMEARKVADEVEKAENYVRKLGKASVRERIAGAGRRENASVDYLSAIDELLDRYDFRRTSAAADQRRGALNTFVDAMTTAGRENELSIPDDVLRDMARTPYKTLSVETLRGVVDSLKNIEHVALRWDKLIDAQQQRALDDVATGIVGQFEKNMPHRPPGRVRTAAEGARNSVRQFFDLVLNATTLLREIDGFEDQGLTYRNIKSPIDDAMNRLIVRKGEAAEALEKLYSVYTKDERRRMSVREYMPDLGLSLSKWERIAVALNTGNEGNYSRLTDRKARGSFTDDQVKAVLATLDARDADFVQSVWDYLGSFKGDIAARERRATGVEPAWVEPSPVEIAGKTLKGGYYPIKYDPRLSPLARDDATQDIAQSIQAGRFGKAQTRNGHLQERVQSTGRDVELDMGVFHRHVNQVIYDLELSEAVANSWRILQDSRVRGAFIDAGKSADFDALEIWLKDVAEGELRSADFVGRAARTLKSNFTAAKLALNLGTAAIQFSGLAQSFVVVGKKDMVRGIVHSFRPGAVADIAAKSPFMASRQTTFNKDIFDFYNDPKTGPVASKWGEVKENIIGPLSFWLMTKTQFYLTDVPTWVGAYEQGLRRFGNDEARAISHADDAVKRAQASGLFSDRSAVERGSVSRTARQNDVVRLFTALGSYMFAKFNVAYERSAKAGSVIGREGFSAKSAQEALSWTLDMTFLFTVEAVIGAAIRGGLPGSSSDDQDEGWSKFLAKQTAYSVVGTVPGVRDVASAVQGFDAGGSYGAITSEVAQPFKLLAQRNAETGLSDAQQRAFVKSVINATGLATGLPATQINRVVDAGWRQADGEDVAPLEYLLGRSQK